MKKRMISLILALCMALSLCACGRQQSETPPAQDETPPQTEQQTQSEPEPQPVAEPEPEDDGDAALDEAVALGIIDAETALRADELALEAEIPAMLQAVYRHGYGKDSAYLAHMADFAIPNRAASRYWFAVGVFYPFCEDYLNAEIADTAAAWAFMDEADAINYDEYFARVDAGIMGIVYNSPKYNFNPQDEGLIRGGFLWDLCFDADTLFEPDGEGREWRHDFGQWWVAQLPFSFYDRVTGEKVLPMDENQLWRPAEKLAVGEAAKAALRYWHYFEAPAVKVAYADVGTYDKSIITDELLNKPTTLPANSCAHLPAEWRGVLFSKMEWVSIGSTSFEPDRIIRAEDIRIVKDAGLNFIKLNLSFSYLQAPNVESSLVNETRLKLLDNILAMCMENDIHLSFACNQYQDFGEYDDFYEAQKIGGSGPSTTEEIADFAAFWGALARRYADIPNEYLSFNLFNEPWIGSSDASEEKYEQVFGPAVDAIRAESPDRTIIADVHAQNITGESMAKRGVALSFHHYIPGEFVYINLLDEAKQNDPEYLHSVTWPFTSPRQYRGTTFNAAKTMEIPIRENSVSLNELCEIAERYGVGVMVGEFGIFGEYRGGFSPYRYTDETYYGYFADMISAFEQKGLGWVLGAFNSTWGMVQTYPAVEGVEYEKVGYYYVDTQMRDFFKSWAK